MRGSGRAMFAAILLVIAGTLIAGNTYVYGIVFLGDAEYGPAT
jgi:hypothetical protein